MIWVVVVRNWVILVVRMVKMKKSEGGDMGGGGGGEEMDCIISGEDGENEKK
jgi:hypothetical protein